MLWIDFIQVSSRQSVAISIFHCQLFAVGWPLSIHDGAVIRVCSVWPWLIVQASPVHCRSLFTRTIEFSDESRIIIKHSARLFVFACVRIAERVASLNCLNKASIRSAGHSNRRGPIVHRISMIIESTGANRLRTRFEWGYQTGTIVPLRHSQSGELALVQTLEFIIPVTVSMLGKGFLFLSPLAISGRVDLI